MNAPTIVIGVLIAAVFLAVVIRGIHNRRRGKGGCSCGCGGCPNRGLCHPEKRPERR